MPDTDSPAILMVEDDAPLAAIVARYLTAHGFTTEVAPSAEAAERSLATGRRPDLILLDINLPGDTGWSLLRGRAYGEAGRPRVVVVSATRITSARLHEYAIAGYLPKPFAMETLLETVRRHTAHPAAEGAVAGPGGERVDVEIP
jgi:two-component system, OmpR family, response regulator